MSFFAVSGPIDSYLPHCITL